MTKLILVIFFSIGFISNTSQFNVFAAETKQIRITEKEIEKYKNKRIFIVKFSNVIFEENGKTIKIPIFQGIYGDVKNKEIIEYCLEKKYINQDMWLHYMIKCEKGQIKKTLREFLNFYKTNILKNVDVDNFNNASISTTEWTIIYDFIIEGVPCYLKIQFSPREEDVDNEPKYKSVYDIIPKENVKDPNFTYLFVVGAKSTD